MKLINFKIIIFLIVADSWSAQTNFIDEFKLFCGLPYINHRVIGGSDAAPGEFPFIARILVNRPNKSPRFLCDGSLITDRHVLTAKHCFTKHLNRTLTVSLGDYNVAPNKVSDDAAIFNVFATISASNYKTSPVLRDLAIIQLAQIVKFTRRISPICLPYKFSTSSLIGKDVTLIGYGHIKQNPTIRPTILQKVQITVRPLSDCKYFAWPAGKICAGSRRSTACFGDSGGPIFKILRQKEGLRYTQVGIVSFGSERNCEKQIIYTDVNFYLKWIKRILNEYR